ncbi:MAG: ATP-dependent 6-phosphofructokinase [Planctomycetota bacterium]
MTATQRRNIGILTGGGDCPGLNAVIRAATKSAIYLGYQVLGMRKGYEGLADCDTMPLNLENTANILDRGGTILGSTNKGRFSAKVGNDESRKIDPKLIELVQQNVDRLQLDGIICIGGDGSLSIAQQLFEAGVPCVGVPKTIDNDLDCTAFTFGFDSAVACAANALDRLHTTAASHERVMILEVMGRHAGWIALHAGIAGGGDVILIPEIDWNFENVCAKVLQRKRMGKEFTLIVVAEGAKLPSGKLVAQDASSENRQTRLGGIGQIVAEEIAERLAVETRCVVLGHLQRGGQPTYFDRCLSTQYGAHAIRLIEEKRFGEMVLYDPPEIGSIAMAEAVKRLSTVNPTGAAVEAARAMAVSFGDSPGYQNPFPQSQVEAQTLVEQYNVPAAKVADCKFDDE